MKAMTVESEAAAAAAAAAGAGDKGAAGAGDKGGDKGAASGGFDINTLQGDKFHAILPEEIRTKPYMKDINSFSDFAKKFDGAQTLIGQRMTPGDDATPEQWNEWFNKAGRPEKPESYVIPEIDGVPKEYIEQASEKGVMKQLFHSAGLNTQQAKILSANFLKTIYTSEQQSKVAADASFEKTMETAFGKDRAAVLENGKKVLAAYVPDSVKPLLAGLDDKAWAVMLAATDGIMKKHVSEDGFRGAGGTGSGGTGPDTKESITAQMRTIMAQPEYGSPHLNRTKNAELNTQMETLREKLRKIS
jgi:hypothetical protein